MVIKSPEGDGHARLGQLPTANLEDAAWLAGISPEALRGFLEAAGVKMATATDGVARVAVAELLRGAFSLLSRKEAQVTMLRNQLHMALEREKTLAEAVQSQLGKPAHGWEQGDLREERSPLPRPPVAQVAAPAPVSRTDKAPRRGKKRP